MNETIAVADIGGTHARFALAKLSHGSVTALCDPVVLRTADYDSLESAWRAFIEHVGGGAPTGLAISFAGPVTGDILRLTNSCWTIVREALRAALGLRDLLVINDFGAVAHAVATLGEDAFQPLCGPTAPLPHRGVISIVGPGTGLGVAALVRHAAGAYEVIETEGGHIGFAPADAVEDRLVELLRQRFGRVSVERLVSGSGLANIHQAIGATQATQVEVPDDKALWTAALDDSDPAASAALDRFCAILGGVAGDFALAQGAAAVVIAGGLGLRLADRLPHSDFPTRFVDKGRFARLMERIPVKVLVHPQPGLFGAAAAFARQAG